LSDELRRYIAQQIELGGAELIVGRAESGRVGGLAAKRAEKAGGAAMRSAELAAPPAKVQASDPPTSQSANPPGLENSMPKRAKQEQATQGGDDKWRKGAPPIPGPGLSVEPPEVELLGNDLSDLKTLDQVAERIRTTYCCDLCPNRTNAVPGEGNPKARMMLVGEAPGATEDQTGRPFVGQAGQLLNGILEAIGLKREDVYITNVVKCRPPQNRKPLPDEIAACIPYLYRQIALIKPKVIVALGGTAAEAMLGVKKSLGDLRGKVHRFGGIPLVVTYHPAALLRNPNWKKPTWDDVRIARQLLDS
jgi:DNA polymerase